MLIWLYQVSMVVKWCVWLSIEFVHVLQYAQRYEKYTQDVWGAFGLLDIPEPENWTIFLRQYDKQNWGVRRFCLLQKERSTYQMASLCSFLNECRRFVLCLPPMITKACVFVTLVHPFFTGLIIPTVPFLEFTKEVIRFLFFVCLPPLIHQPTPSLSEQRTSLVPIFT